ncbi:MAG: YdcF family protein [Opitutaceae bacterium]
MRVESCSRCRRILRVCLWTSAAGFASLVLLLVFHAPVLRGIALAWVVSDDPVRSDAIVVLAGSVDSRPHAASALYHRGMAPKIMLTDIPAHGGIERPGLDYASGTLMANGVPEDAIVIRRSGVQSTFDEARTTLAWAESAQADKLLVVTDAFHTRRTRWIFSRIFAGHGIEVRIIAADPVGYELDRWWTSEFGLVDFHEEVIKYIHYRLNY